MLGRRSWTVRNAGRMNGAARAHARSLQPDRDRRRLRTSALPAPRVPSSWSGGSSDLRGRRRSCNSWRALSGVRRGRGPRRSRGSWGYRGSPTNGRDRVSPVESRQGTLLGRPRFRGCPELPWSPGILRSAGVISAQSCRSDQQPSLFLITSQASTCSRLSRSIAPPRRSISRTRLSAME